ncbi:hypothetical protein AAEX28_02020 [Lentisphaerota bacterium WC36G]|nr:hypothetical protein LJT99_04905 [Lentisphaerae bacterium WC36]
MKKLFFMLIVCTLTGCTVDYVGLYSRLGGRGKYALVEKRLKNRIKEDITHVDQMAYKVMLAIMCRKQHMTSDYLQAIDQAKTTNTKYNYLAFRELAIFYKEQGDKINEKKALEKAKVCLTNLLNDYENNIVSEDVFKRYSVVDFYMSYYIYKIKTDVILGYNSLSEQKLLYAKFIKKWDKRIKELN